MPGYFRAPQPVAPEAVLPPLAVQQARAYPEAATGCFVSLADFEDSPLTGASGRGQLAHFAIDPPAEGAALKFVVNVTRTGTGALEAVLPPGSALVHLMREVHNFSEYTLLSASIYSPAIRDDFKVRISTGLAGWESPPVLLKPGWNTVLIDLARLKAMPEFDARGVVSMRFWLAQAGHAVRINVDDIMLVDNSRQITPAPIGMWLVKKGLDYELTVGGRPTIRIAQCDDGLWRLGADQMGVVLGGAGAAGETDLWPVPTVPTTTGLTPAPLPEDIAVMGPRRVGQVEVLEHNALRLRLANTWYFPDQTGQWESLEIRQIRWEYTFYGDGRWVTDLVLDNAGGEAIASVQLTAPAGGAWSDGRRGRARPAEKLPASAGRWDFLSGGQEHRQVQESNFMRPPAVSVSLGACAQPGGQAGADGFDRSQGCYRLLAKTGHCRFVLAPQAEGLAEAVVRVSGKWNGPVTIHSAGLAIRNSVRLADGSVLLVVPGLVERPTSVEVTGPVPLLEP